MELKNVNIRLDKKLVTMENQERIKFDILGTRSETGLGLSSINKTIFLR